MPAYSRYSAVFIRSRDRKVASPDSEQCRVGQVRDSRTAVCEPQCRQKELSAEASRPEDCTPPGCVGNVFA